MKVFFSTVNYNLAYKPSNYNKEKKINLLCDSRTLHPMTADLLKTGGLVNFCATVTPNGIVKTDLAISYENLWNKIENQQCILSLNDINKLVREIKKETGESDHNIEYALYVLTQFGNVHGIRKLAQKVDREHHCRRFSNVPDISANTVLNYFCIEKEQALLNKRNSAIAFILDDPGINFLKKLKATKPQKFEEFKEGKIFINPIGWNYGINMFNQSSDLSRLSENCIKLIKKTQKHRNELKYHFEEDFNDVINKEFNKQIKGLNIFVTSIKLEKEKANLKESILYNLQPLHIKKHEVKNTIETVIDFAYPIANVEEKNKYKEIFAKYLAEQIEIFTPQKMGDELKNLKRMIDLKIEKINEKHNTNYTDEDILYLIPIAQKSYTPIALQYANVNNIPIEKFSEPPGRTFMELEDHKIYVILDDVAATGSSFDKDFYQYLHNPQQNNHILYCPIATGETGRFVFYAWKKEKNREDKDFLVSDFKNLHQKVNDTDFYYNLSPLQKNMFKNLINKFSCNGKTRPLGVEETFVNVASKMHTVDLPGAGYAFCFPYMTPDNNAALPYFLFRNLFLNPFSEKAVKNLIPFNQTSAVFERINRLNRTADKD